MGLYLEATTSCRGGRTAGTYCLRRASTNEVVEAVRLGAFASPDSPFDLHNVGVFPLIKNNRG
jgi:hypothetical protein